MKSRLILLLVSGVTLLHISCSMNNPKPATLTGDELVQRGKYLVDITGCSDCHSPKIMTPQGPQIDPKLDLSGYPSNRPLGHLNSEIITKDGWNVFDYDLTAYLGMWGVSFAANITSDESGIGNWTEDQFKKALTKGKFMGMDNQRMLLPPMPWQDFAKTTDDDVKAIFAYLKSTKPVKNVVPNPIPLNGIK